MSLSCDWDARSYLVATAIFPSISVRKKTIQQIKNSKKSPCILIAYRRQAASPPDTSKKEKWKLNNNI